MSVLPQRMLVLPGAGTDWLAISFKGGLPVVYSCRGHAALQSALSSPISLWGCKLLRCTHVEPVLRCSPNLYLHTLSMGWELIAVVL